jgi:hypothetical protein
MDIDGEYIVKRLFAIATTGGLSSKVPPAVDALLDPAVVRSDVEPLWREFRACYPSEAAAVAAAEQNEAVVLLPFLNTPSNIEGCWRVLNSLFSEEEALQIITDNPGILTNLPGQLRRSSVREIRASVGLVQAVSTIPKGVRSLIPTFTAVTSIALIAKRLADCAGQVCG